MTSDLLQLFTQALETLISWSSFDCIPDSGLCTSMCGAFMKKQWRHYHTTLYWSCPLDGFEMLLSSLQQYFIEKGLDPLFRRWDGAFSDEMCTAVLFASPPGRGSLRGGGSVVLHKCDGCQLLAKLFQHNHALQQGDVVHPGRDKRATRQSG